MSRDFKKGSKRPPADHPAPRFTLQQELEARRALAKSAKRIDAYRRWKRPAAFALPELPHLQSGAREGP
jgi:hypothetical protein